MSTKVPSVQPVAASRGMFPDVAVGMTVAAVSGVVLVAVVAGVAVAVAAVSGVGGVVVELAGVWVCAGRGEKTATRTAAARASARAAAKVFLASRQNLTSLSCCIMV